MINWSASCLDVYIWDVGHGLSVTIITPFVQQAMGTPLNRRRVIQFDVGVNNKYNFSPILHLTNNRGLQIVDWLILSHPDQDHISDLPNILRLQQGSKLEVLNLMRNVTIPDAHISEDPFQESQPKTVYKHLNSSYVHQVAPANWLLPANFGGVEVGTIFLPYQGKNDFNNASIVASVKFGSIQLIIPGDLAEEGAASLIDTGQMVAPAMNCFRLLVAPHHGSDTAKPAKLLRYLKPHKVLASVEENHEFSDPLYSSPEYVYGHPITKSNGVEEVRRFTGTKGELIHLQTYGHYPNLKKQTYDQYLDPLSRLIKSFGVTNPPPVK